MKYKIQNTSTSVTVWIDTFNQGNAFPLAPGEKCSVPESTKIQVLRENPFLVDLGTVTDPGAPAYKSAAGTASWVLWTIGPGTTQYSKLRFSATTGIVQISFSGWDTTASETAPPTWSVIDIPIASATTPYVELDLGMDPTNSFYVKSATGTLTVIAS